MVLLFLGGTIISYILNHFFFNLLVGWGILVIALAALIEAHWAYDIKSMKYYVVAVQYKYTETELLPEQKKITVGLFILGIGLFIGGFL
jgi:hypothetical protein